MTNINKLLLKMEGFQYATWLVSNMGYYKVWLSEDTSNLCTIIIPWGKYRYKRLPMEITNYPDIFNVKWMIFPIIWIYPCLYKHLFDFEKNKLDRSHTKIGTHVK